MVSLENNRVKLIPLTTESFHDLFSIAQNMTMTYSPSSINTEQNFKNYIENALNDSNTIAFSIYDKLKQQYAGSTRFYMISHQNKRLAIGYTWIGNIFQGSGLNQNCKYLLLSHAFENLQMEKQFL